MDKCREEFEKHYLNLPFHDSKAAQKCLDSCDFDVKQNVYIPNAKWFLDNDTDEGVIYCCMLNTAYMSFQHQLAKMEELQKQLNEYIFVAETLDEMYVKELKSSDELQKRVQFLEQELGAWKGKSIAAMINGMCGQCGKEPWQAIRSNKDGYALLHCFGCGANKYELMGEQALKGGA
ncbi:hypothetical protein ACLD07_02455 [Acinetobacter baumannii]|uniref:hypothetical protein n=1 Tax=Acinetobacter calcoaceticus/baumannii complex TaxID=909768 RepID=UPI0002CDF7AD|nr:hypothetical protein [Acinetobacter pittii]ENW11445.1 hypothetical protein F930_01392 [Acinetobacter pittii ANC 3678]